MIKGILFDFDKTLSTENSIVFMMKWQARRYFESERHFNPFYGILDVNRLFFYGFRYIRHLRNLFSKKNYNKPIDEIIIQYGKFVSTYYPYILKSFKNSGKEDLIKISKHIPLRPEVKEMLLEIKKRNIKIGICSMSLEIAALSSLYFITLDYTACNNLIYRREYGAFPTGNSFIAIKGAVDKKNVVLEFCDKFGLSKKEVAYVGDDFHDFLAADIAGVGLILLNPKKINKKNYFFYKKAIDKFDFKVITSISQVLQYINDST